MSAPHLLMCPPDHFGIHYEINPWMQVAVPSEPTVATQQWQGLRALVERLGAEVSCMPPVPGLPDLVFTANAGLIYRDMVVLSRFRHPQRQGEVEHQARWFRERGFQTRELPPGTYFEGAGDALFAGETLVAGYRTRTSIRALYEIGQWLRCRVIPVEMVAPRFYHLDTCFCPLSAHSAIYYPAAFDEYGRRVLADLVPDSIAVDDAEAARFACNAVVLGHDVVANTGCDGLARQLAERGLSLHQTPLDEFLKAGGAAKCLTLRLDGEDAAAWRTDASVALRSAKEPLFSQGERRLSARPYPNTR